MDMDADDRPDPEAVHRGLRALCRRFAPILASLPAQDTDEGVFEDLVRETAGLDYYRREVNSRCL